ncbi:hypothetical protein [Pseudomonas sp.]|uniref:hypothetical protein n=1 Tax=Pseudomonas sp. TaxID=306 RepID=UPI0033401FF5
METLYDLSRNLQGFKRWRGGEYVAYPPTCSPKREPLAPSFDMGQAVGSCVRWSGFEPFGMAEFDRYRLERWRLDGILIRAGYVGFVFWQSMGLFPARPKDDMFQGGVLNKDAHRCPR